MTRSTAAPPLSTLIFLSCLAVMPINLFLPSLPHIADEFQVDFTRVSLTISGFAIAAAVAQLVAGPLSDWYGHRPIALGTTVIFIGASIGCILATDFDTFLFFRILQAVVVAGYGLSLAVINETSKEREAASKIGYVATAYAVVPMIGPTVGGGLDQLFGWRASFLLFTLCGVLVFGLVFFKFAETKRSPSKSFRNYLHQYRQLTCSLRLWGHASCMALSIGTLYVFLGAAPLISETSFDISSATLGAFMGLVPGGFLLGSYLSGRYAAKMPYSVNMLVGRLVTVAGLLSGLALALFEVGHVLAFFGPCLFIGLGNGLTMPSANAGAISVQPDLAGSAAGLASAATLAGGAMVAAVASLFFSETNTMVTLFCILLAVSSLGLLAALFVLLDDRRLKRLTP